MKIRLNQATINKFTKTETTTRKITTMVVNMNRIMIKMDMTRIMIINNTTISNMIIKTTITKITIITIRIMITIINSTIKKNRKMRID